MSEPPLVAPRPKDLESGATGICISGGGIRAAAFGLGALQAFSDAGLLRGRERARYLAAVSGGSYIAGAYAMVARGPMTEQETSASEAGGAGVLTPEVPFARSSPEEQWVRNHLRYLGHGPRSLLTAMGRFLAGIFINISFIAITLTVVGIPLGLVYGRAFPALHSVRPGAISVHIPDWSVSLAVGCSLGGAACGVLAVLVRFKNDVWRRRLTLECAVLIGVGGLAALLLIGIPQALVFVRNLPVGGKHSPHSPSTASAGLITSVTVVGFVGSVITGVAALLGGASTEGTGVRDAERWLLGKLRKAWPHIRSFALNGLAALFGPALVVGLLLLAISNAASHTTSQLPRELTLLVICLLLFGFMYVWGDLVEWSLHPLYKRRLASAFSLRQVRLADGSIAAEERPYRFRYPMSALANEDTPELLICAAVNVSDYGRTPTASNVGGFVFSATQVGGPLVGQMPMQEYEQAAAARWRDFTVPAAVSITGAAIAPSMGRMTRRPLRFLMAILNLRLGVWLPNPALVVNEFRSRNAASADERTTPGKPGVELLATAEEDLGLRRWAKLAKPGVRYLAAELLGINRVGSRYIYVSDGGHYENLGLVELLRRGCETIWCVDAAGDRIDAFSTVAEAISLARSELGVDIDLRPEVMAPATATGPEARFVQHTHVVGTITYPSGKVGTLVFVKLGVPADAPSDLLAFHRRYASFPCDPTLNQLFTADRFDAYRALGEFATHRAVTTALRGNGSPVAPPLPVSPPA